MKDQSRNWHAWINTMPLAPKTLNVAGDIPVGNPGVEAILVMREPQGISPSILLLDLYLTQRPGMWPQVVSCASVNFHRVIPPGTPDVSSIEIYSSGEKIVTIDDITVVT